MGGIRGFRDRLLAERTGGNWVLVLFAEAVLAFALASTLIQFGNAAGPWSAPAAVAGGIVCPVLGVLLIAGHPDRYRAFGYPVRAWLTDRVILGVPLIVAFLTWPVYALTGGHAHGAPGWIILVPVLALVVTTAAVLRHHRHLLAGRVRTSSRHRTWDDRMFLARTGPVAWQTVYQPVGMMAFGAALVTVIWTTRGDPDVYALPAAATITALACAPVATGSQQAGRAVGMTRRAWLRHTVTAVAVPTAAFLAVGVFGGLGQMPSVKEMGTGRMVPLTGAVLGLTVVVAVLAGVLAGALAVVFSYEDIGSCILWFLLINFLLLFFPQFRWNGLTQVGGAWLQIVWVGLVTLVFLSYARHRVMTGRPDWSGTRLVRPRQSRRTQGAA